MRSLELSIGFQKLNQKSLMCITGANIHLIENQALTIFEMYFKLFYLFLIF